MIFITLYLNFLQFLTDYSESKDRVVPSSINIMKLIDYSLKAKNSQSDFGATFKIAFLLKYKVAYHLVRVYGVTYARDICRASRETLTGIRTFYFQFYTTGCARRWLSTSQQINALGHVRNIAREKSVGCTELYQITDGM